MGRDRYGIKFSKSTAKRVLDTARYVEQQPRSHGPGTGSTVIVGPNHFGGAAMLLTTTILTRMSGATPGTGYGKLQKFNGTSYSDFSSTIFKIINDTTAQVAVGAYVLCVPGPGGLYHWSITSCSNIS